MLWEGKDNYALKHDHNAQIRRFCAINKKHFRVRPRQAGEGVLELNNDEGFDWPALAARRNRPSDKSC